MQQQQQMMQMQQQDMYGEEEYGQEMDPAQMGEAGGDGSNALVSTPSICRMITETALFRICNGSLDSTKTSTRVCTS